MTMVRGRLRFQDLPIAYQFTLVCVGLCVAFVLILTTAGYVRASEGLHEQAQAALSADGLVVTTRPSADNAACACSCNTSLARK